MNLFGVHLVALIQKGSKKIHRAPYSPWTCPTLENPIHLWPAPLWNTLPTLDLTHSRTPYSPITSPPRNNLLIVDLPHCQTPNLDLPHLPSGPNYLLKETLKLNCKGREETDIRHQTDIPTHRTNWPTGQFVEQIWWLNQPGNNITNALSLDLNIRFEGTAGTENWGLFCFILKTNFVSVEFIETPLKIYFNKLSCKPIWCIQECQSPTNVTIWLLSGGKCSHTFVGMISVW